MYGKIWQNLAKQFTFYSAEPHSEPCQTAKRELFVKIVNQFQLLTIFAQSFIIDFWQGSVYAAV